MPRAPAVTYRPAGFRQHVKIVRCLGEIVEVVAVYVPGEDAIAWHGNLFTSRRSLSCSKPSSCRTGMRPLDKRHRLLDHRLHGYLGRARMTDGAVHMSARPALDGVINDPV